MSEVNEEKLASKDNVSTREIRADTENIYTDGTIDETYQTKARILNDALQEIGMGKYQVRTLCSNMLQAF